MAVLIVQVVRGQTVEPLWIETLMIALAHYFTSRRFISLPPEVIHRLEAEGYLEEERNPLYLPRLTIRLVIVLAFIALAAHLFKEGKLFEPQALSLVGVVFAYLLGTVVRGLLDWWRGWRLTGGQHVRQNPPAARRPNSEGPGRRAGPLAQKLAPQSVIVW